MVEVHGARRAFQVLNRAPKFREQLGIHPEIWKRLSEEVQNKIKKARDSIREEGRSEQPNNSPPKAIPPQYGLNKSANNTTKENEGAERLAAMIQSYEIGNETFSDSSDLDEEDVRMSAMVHRVGENIDVQANIEYERRFLSTKHLSRSSYAICDSAADSCIVGEMAKVEMVTNRTANLSGHDPETTRSPKLPIVTALIKTLTKKNMPILLQVHEAVYNKNSTITLLSEYQLREHGVVIDSVARKHLSTGGTYGTQTLYASEGKECP